MSRTSIHAFRLAQKPAEFFKLPVNRTIELGHPCHGANPPESAPGWWVASKAHSVKALISARHADGLAVAPELWKEQGLKSSRFRQYARAD